jgi:hypothetical protein
VFETFIRLQWNNFKKADCPSNGSKWKIYSSTEGKEIKCQSEFFSHNHLVLIFILIVVDPFQSPAMLTCRRKGQFVCPSQSKVTEIIM